MLIVPITFLEQYVPCLYCLEIPLTLAPLSTHILPLSAVKIRHVGAGSRQTVKLHHFLKLLCTFPFNSTVPRHERGLTFTDEAQTALFKDPVRTAL